MTMQKNLRTFNHPALLKHLESDAKRIGEILLTKTADEWEEAFNQQKVPAARVRSLDETLDDAQLEFRDVIQTTNDTDQSRIPLASFKFSKNGPELKSPPPHFGQHTNEILEELGYNDEEISRLKSKNIIANNK